MPSDISIDPAASSAALAPAKAEAPALQPTPIAASPGSPASPNLPNPRMTVDPSLNRVVLEFFSSSGSLTNTIPSQKQLEAYRLAAFSGTSETAGSGD